MKKRIQIGLFGLACAGCGWLSGHFGLVQTSAQTAQPKNATNVEGFTLKVRAAGEAKFTDQSKRFELEVYRDENNGNLIYITDTGAVAVVSPK